MDWGSLLRYSGYVATIIPNHRADLRQTLRRGLAKRCPQCGEASIFRSFMTVVERCPVCRCPIQSREENTYFLMYVTTAALTGVVILGMFAVTPRHFWLGRLFVVAAALCLYLGTYQRRKGLAIAVEYCLDPH